MKICIISLNSYYFFSEGKKASVGGAELDMFLVGKYLALDKDFKVSFIVGDFGQAEIENFNDIKLYRSISIKKRNFFEGTVSVIRFVVTLFRADADYYMISAAGHHVGIASIFCKIFRKKFIYRTAHDMDCNGEFIEKNGFFGQMYKLGLLTAYKILTSVENHNDLLKKNHGNRIADKISYLPYGIESDAEASFDKDTILWIARGTFWKRPEIFLKLAESFPEEKFVLIMPKQAGEEDFFEKTKEEAEKIKNVSFIGGVLFSETQEYFDKAKIFINTSDHEGFTFTLIQSGIAKTPVVYFKVNPDNIINKFGLGYFANGNIETMRNQMGELLNNKEDWKKRSDNCFNYIRNNHDIRVTIEKYKELLNGKNNKNNKNICFVSIYSYPLFNPDSNVSFGGSEVQLFQIGNEMSNISGHDINFVVGNFGQKKKEIFGNIKVFRAFSLTRKRFRYVKGFFCYLKFFYILKKIDADIYVQRAAAIETGATAFFCKIFRKRFVYMTAHEIDCNGDFRKINPLAGLFYEFGLKKASIVVSQSNVQQQMLRERFGIKALISKSGYDIPELNFLEKENFILWVARLDKWKQPEIFIELAKKFPAENFIMIAPESNDKNYSNNIYDLVSKVKNIKLLTRVPFEKINEYFRKAKVFINTSKYEGFPNTFIQAAMNKTPIISLNVNPDSMIDANKIGFFSNNRIDDLRQNLKMLLENENSYAIFSENAYNYAKENHDIKKISRNLLEMIKM